jgi:hypothetical protein
MNNQEHVSYQHQVVLKFIELRALWEGRVNAGHLYDAFGISRDSVSKLIKRYSTSCPTNLQYNTSLKGHIPTRQFVPHYSTGSLEEYMLSFQMADPSGNPAHPGFGQCFPMRQFERSPSPDVVRPVLNAIREKRRIDLSYLSMSSTNYEDRIISPHSLVHTGSRWHVRAWCEKNQDFRDYVLSRITEVYNDEGPAEHTVEADIKWNTLIDITLEPDVRLPQDKKKVLAHDYCMEQGEDGRYTRTYSVRAAMVIYILHHLGLDRLREQSVAQQVMLTPESAERVKPYQG